MITIAQLIAAGVSPTQARTFVDPINAACAVFGIDSKVRIAAFVSQAAHESSFFTRLEENLTYRTPERIRAVFSSRVHSLEEASHLVGRPQELANRVYAGRLGNGDEASGDGWRFRGRGIFQLTGRANYMAAGDALGQPYKSQPELVAQPEGACMTAAWYWKTRNLNPLADAANVFEITRAINGPAAMGYIERKHVFDDLVQVMAA